MLNIREARESLGLTQQQLADLCGVTSTYISQIERGKRSPSPALEKIIALELARTQGAPPSSPQVTAGRDATVALGHGATATNGGDLAGQLAQIRADLADIKTLLIKLAAK